MGNQRDLQSIFKKRFDELEEHYVALPRIRNSSTPGTHIPSGAWRKWTTSAQSLIRAVCGENSPHYINFVAEVSRCYGYDSHIDAVHGQFLSAKEDFDNGYIFNVELRVSSEVFGDFILMAKSALSEGYIGVSAVLACAALEDALKRYAVASGLDVSEQSMQGVVNALKAAGLVSGARKSLLDPMPRIRNCAMHAEWEKLSAPDVSSVIGFVEQFLLSSFEEAGQCVRST